MTYETDNLITSNSEQPVLEDIVYRESQKPPLWYEFAPAFSVGLTSLAVAFIGIMMLLDGSLVTKLCGALALTAYALYAGRYLYHFFRSRKLMTYEAVLTQESLLVACPAWTKQFAVSDIVFTMSYSSSTNLCMIVATEDDYAVIRCSCGYLLAKDGKQYLKPFYALNKQLMTINPEQINFVRNKRYRRKNPIRIPLYIFETEFDSARASKLIDQLRQTHRFR